MKKRIFLFGLLTMILMAGFFSPALAKPPVTVVEEFHEGEAFDFDGCGDFILDFEEDFTLRQTTFFDKDDNPVRFQSQFTIKGTVLNTGTGTVMRSFGRGLFSEDLTGEKDAFDTGVHLQLIAPNKGVVGKWMGLVIFDGAGTFKGVQQPPLDDIDAICDTFRDI